MRTGPVEITDLLWPVDEEGRPVPVVRDEAVALLRERGQPAAARLVASMPRLDGLIDLAYLEGLALRIHRELQRLGEELQLDRRVAELLHAPIHRLLAADPSPVTVLDIGCGLGHVLRASSARRLFPTDVWLVGVDLNRVLIAEARRLAAAEALDCRFVHGDAFDLTVVGADPARTVVISTGLLHHFEPTELAAFFAQQAAIGVAGFAHWDIAPCFWSTLGAWAFHRARMREPVSRHDGVLSARRAHPAPVLLEAANAGAPQYRVEVLEGPRWYPRALDVLRPIVGWR